MKTNIGTMDRFFRVVVSVPFIVYGIMHSSLIGLIGIVLLATAVIGWCGLYTMFGFDTCKYKDADGNCKL
jgi:hypothetical protein